MTKAEKLEKVDERQFAKHVENEGCLQRKFSILTHDPDRIIFGPGGRTLLIEWKQVGKPIKKGQLNRLIEFADLGFTTCVCHTFTEALDYFNKWMGEYYATLETDPF